MSRFDGLTADQCIGQLHAEMVRVLDSLDPEVGELVDTYTDVRELRRMAGKLAEMIAERERELERRVIDEIESGRHGPGLMGTQYRAAVVPDTRFIAEDWEAVEAHVRATGDVSLFEKRLAQARLKSMFEAGEVVPGVGRMVNKGLSVRKV